MDKKLLLGKVIASLEADVAKQRESFESMRQASADAPGRMQSRYDSSKTEMGWVAQGLGRALREKEADLVSVKSTVLPDSPSAACLGCVVGMSTMSTDRTEYFFLIPGPAGSVVEHDGRRITTLTPNTPLGRALVGKRVGDVFEISFPKPRSVTIVKVL